MYPVQYDPGAARTAAADQDSSAGRHSRSSIPLSAGTRLGPYEIGGALGAGGMGELHDVGHQDGTDYIVMEYLERRLHLGYLRRRAEA